MTSKWTKKVTEPPHDKTNITTVRPAKTQISLGICLVWSAPSLCPQCLAKYPCFLHVDSDDSDQTGQMPRLIWVFAGRTCHYVVMRQCVCDLHPQLHIKFVTETWRPTVIIWAFKSAGRLAAFGSPTKRPCRAFIPALFTSCKDNQICALWAWIINWVWYVQNEIN